MPGPVYCRLATSFSAIGSFPPQRSTANSFLLTILPITPMGRGFCAQRLGYLHKNEEFAENPGGGGYPLHSQIGKPPLLRRHVSPALCLSAPQRIRLGRGFVLLVCKNSVVCFLSFWLLASSSRWWLALQRRLRPVRRSLPPRLMLPWPPRQASKLPSSRADASGARSQSSSG